MNIRAIKQVLSRSLTHCRPWFLLQDQSLWALSCHSLRDHLTATMRTLRTFAATTPMVGVGASRQISNGPTIENAHKLIVLTF